MDDGIDDGSYTKMRKVQKRSKYRVQSRVYFEMSVSNLRSKINISGPHREGLMQRHGFRCYLHVCVELFKLQELIRSHRRMLILESNKTVIYGYYQN